jgi:hypothetical protein
MGVPFYWARQLDDHEWFQAHDALAGGAISGTNVHRDLPGLPTSDQQTRFTGYSGTENLQQAFRFYRYCLDITSARGPVAATDRILDFGCGWGRVARFWLREVRPSQIWCIDCMTDAIELLHSTRMPANILKNNPLPPVTGLPESFRLIYAYSVFSHLSEDAALQWIDYFAEHLEPGGHLVFTTMGLEYLAVLRHLRTSPPEDYHQVRTLELAPGQDELETRYAAGEFVFFGTGGGGELTEDFYGMALIPDAWLQRLDRGGLKFCGSRQDAEGINQSIVVMQKPD